MRGLMFPSKRDMLKRFKEVVPNYDCDIEEVRVESETMDGVSNINHSDVVNGVEC